MSKLSSYSENQIRSQAMKRLAQLFNFPVEQLSIDARFGIDLLASPRSWLKDNAYDEIDGDIRDVANGDLRNQMASGKYVVCTAGDYCNHMILCFSMRPAVVAKILNLNEL